MLIDGVRKIAVLRANALGDFLQALPALEALRAAYPAAELVLLGADWHAALLTGRPGPVDRVVPVPSTPGVRLDGPADPDAVAAFVAAMRAERFDLAVQMHGGGRSSNPFVRRLGARVTAGLRAADAPPLDRTLPYAWYQPEVLRHLELVGLVGAEPVTLHPRLSLVDADRREAAAVLPAGGLVDADRREAAAVLRAGGLVDADRSEAAAVRPAGGPVVALHPGATDPRRRWPVRSFAAVGDGLAARGATVLVTGSGPERSTVAGVVAAMRAPAVPLVDAVSIGGLAALYARCSVVVANDTGPRHLAAAVGAATVGVYWAGNLVTAGPMTRRRHRAHVSWTTRCPACGAALPEPELPARHHGRPCPHDDSWVSEVDPAAVLADAVDLLGLEGPPSGRWSAAGDRPVASLLS